ncbi:sigma-70 family RNA polymerase sigma factor [Streptomyces sp. AP-93]|uniref:sigma-70 family RNA polymerase sigma factor n=1 Tax=Streptomyces sp. AP-93 TaxID=2929048 RepID=UPI001FAE9B6A|nr:sigma-70 family RNA polymerase sigma factor [Streptomyces sp. AP-93]MCJ0869435.1 sigma-70 family RNA polymerase sigma factor [Streptomyces sp. AP-93]
MSTQHTAALVAAARAGDPRAQDDLVSAYLPLVYNIVGRALNGSVDVDDVVQDTMLRALDGLGGLRDDHSFRSWLVAIAMNRVRAHWQARRSAPGESGLEAAWELADPGADFVDLTVVRLQLEGQRRETARATRWLEPDDRALLSLWWLECAGELTRAEMAHALELSAQHTAVRVQRMKAQLEAARVVERALGAQPPCEDLRVVVASWDGLPSALWRKRIARHARACLRCGGLWNGLVPAEGLLAGLALLPVSAALLAGVRAATDPGFTSAGLATTASAYDAGGSFAPGAGPSDAGGSFAPGAGPSDGGGAQFAPAGVPGDGRASLRRQRRTRGRRRVIGGAVLAACVVGGGVTYLATRPDAASPEAPAAALVAPESGTALPPEPASPTPSPSASASATASPSLSPSPTPSPTPKPTPTPTPKPSPKSTPPKSPAPAPPGGSTVSQVISLVNSERAKAGCGPLKDDAKLRTAAQGHSDDMARRDFFSHTNPDGADPGRRTTAAGYRWSTYGENIAKGQRTAVSVMDSWMNSQGHRENILNCAFKDIGVGIHQGDGGPWWTQNFGARM